MDKGTGGRLKKMAAFARYIDEVFSELERALSSVDALMPDEAHHEQARCIMETLLEEITEMDVSVLLCPDLCGLFEVMCKNLALSL